jgi:hypothetical protein
MLCDGDREAQRFFGTWRGSLMLHQFSEFIFLTLHMYAAVAGTLGYKVQTIRHLAGPTRLNYGNVLSDEVICAPETFYTLRYGRDRSDYPIALQADYLLLHEAAESLPPAYAARLAEVEAELAQMGIDAARAKTTVRSYLESRGAGEQALGRQEFAWLKE